LQLYDISYPVLWVGEVISGTMFSLVNDLIEQTRTDRISWTYPADLTYEVAITRDLKLVINRFDLGSARISLSLWLHDIKISSESHSLDDNLGSRDPVIILYNEILLSTSRFLIKELTTFMAADNALK